MPTTPPTEGTVRPLESLPHLRLSDRERIAHRPPPDEEPPDEEGSPRGYPALTPRVRREAIVFGVALLVGFVGMPFLIWFAGNRVLGPYTHGQNTHAGPFALLSDFYLGLLHGSAVFWMVALGPAALVLLLRLFVALVRALPRMRRPA
jgi:hypothetical protein